MSKSQSNLLPEDGIVDEIAIEIAVSGQRVVRMTERERRIAARRIIDSGGDVAELAAKLGISTIHVAPLVESLGGYRIGPRCPKTKHRDILRAA